MKPADRALPGARTGGYLCRHRMLVPHAFATHFARTVELFRDPQAKTGQKAQFRALLALLKHDAVTLKRAGGTVTVNGTAVDGAAFEPIRRQLERHSVGELTIPANPPPDQVFQLLTALAGEPGAADLPTRLRASGAERITVAVARLFDRGEESVTIERTGEAGEGPTRAPKLDLGTDGILHGDSMGDAGPGPTPIVAPEVSNETPGPAATARQGQVEERDMTPLLIKNQSPETLLAELERQPHVVNAGEVLVKLAQHIDLALRSNKIERALKLTTGILRCEQAVPEGSRRQYAIALKRMFTRGLLEGVAHLTQLAGHQAEAVAVLQRAGASGVEVLLDQLVASPSLEERSGTFAALTHMKEGLEQVIHLLDHHQWFVVRNVAELAGELGLEAAVPHLAKQLEHEDERVRKSVALALAKVGSRGAAEPLRRALKDPSREVRMHAAMGVGGRKASPLAMPLVVALEEEEDEEVERELILALGRIGSPDAVQALIRFAQPSGKLFGRKSTSVRLAAVEALRIAATPAAVGTLQGLCDDGDKDIRAASVVALAQMKKKR